MKEWGQNIRKYRYSNGCWKRATSEWLKKKKKKKKKEEEEEEEEEAYTG